MEHQSPDTVCGYVKDTGREGQISQLFTLKEFGRYQSTDMLTTVYIGNSQTKIINGKMVTPRGYRT